MRDSNNRKLRTLEQTFQVEKQFLTEKAKQAELEKQKAIKDKEKARKRYEKKEKLCEMEFRMYKNFNNKLPFKKEIQKLDTRDSPEVQMEQNFQNQNVAQNSVNQDILGAELLGNQRLRGKSQFVQDFNQNQIFSHPPDQEYQVQNQYPENVVLQNQNQNIQNIQNVQNANRYSKINQSGQQFSHLRNVPNLSKENVVHPMSLGKRFAKDHDSLQNFITHQTPSNFANLGNLPSNSTHNDVSRFQGHQTPNMRNFPISKPRTSSNGNNQTPLYSNHRRAVSRQGRRTRMIGSSYSLGVKPAETRFTPSKPIFQQNAGRFFEETRRMEGSFEGNGVSHMVKKEDLEDQHLNELLEKYKHDL